MKPVAARRYLIRRCDRNYFSGWVVGTKRRGKRFRRYFSDKRKGSRAALQEAIRYRDKLLSTLPSPNKIKLRYVRNTTGVVGVSRSKETTRGGQEFVRYRTAWPTRSGTIERASFSVSVYGEKKAFHLAVAARKAGLHELDSCQGFD